MSRPKCKTIRIGSGFVPVGSPEYKADLARRLKAAGLDLGDDAIETMPIDDFRKHIGRKLVMITNKWSGCPEALCQRMGGCMAPSGNCVNLPDEPFDREAWDRDKIQIIRAIRTEIARREAAGEGPGDC